nr:MAG TPA: hypothetical protein [Caudoviricetes sp.]
MIIIDRFNYISKILNITLISGNKKTYLNNPTITLK